MNNIRRKLAHNEDEQESLQWVTKENGQYPVELFLGSCHGIALSRRNINDNHIVMTWLTEDDGCWFPSESLGSSYWMQDSLNVLRETIEWIEKNAEPDIPPETNESWPKGVPCGYKFK